MSARPLLALTLALAFGACAAPPSDPGTGDDDVGGGKEDSATPTGDPTLYPIVLVHGFNASPTRNGFGPEIVKALCADGHSVFVPALPPFAAVADRAAVLAETVDAALAGKPDACGVTPKNPPTKVNLIAHSMGGLDSRFLVASLGYGDSVASVTTLSTPHRGSAMADMVLGLISGVDPGALSAVATMISRSLGNPNTLPPDLVAAFTSLTEAGAEAFNRDNPDDLRVHYESWAGLSNIGGIPNDKDVAACENKMGQFPTSLKRHVMHFSLQAIATTVAHGFELLPNDGLVRVSSSKWTGFRGCLPSDHLDEVGGIPPTATPFPYIRFLRSRAFELAAKGY